MNGYVCFYGSKRIEVRAETLYAAQQAAVKELNPPKSKKHMVHCALAEKGGEQVTHVATD